MLISEIGARTLWHGFLHNKKIPMLRKPIAFFYKERDEEERDGNVKALYP